MEIKEVEMCPFIYSGLQLWNPEFREMNILQIKESAKLDTQYYPYGYTKAYFVRSTATIHLYR